VLPSNCPCAKRLSTYKQPAHFSADAQRHAQHAAQLELGDRRSRLDGLVVDRVVGAEHLALSSTREVIERLTLRSPLRTFSRSRLRAATTSQPGSDSPSTLGAGGGSPGAGCARRTIRKPRSAPGQLDGRVEDAVGQRLGARGRAPISLFSSRMRSSAARAGSAPGAPSTVRLRKRNKG
jgi:hypothetical protein